MHAPYCFQSSTPGLFSLAWFSSRAIMADEKVVVRHALVAQSGEKHVVLDHITVGGIAFIKLAKRNSQLLSLCSARKGNKYFPGVDVFQYLVQKRNDEVSRLIKLAARSDDPFAESERADDAAEDDMQYSRRQELFTKHGIPEIIELSIPEFESGKIKHGAIQIQVLATPKMAASTYMEASGVNLKWFKLSCSYEWLALPPSPSKRKAVDIGSLQIEASPLVKVKKNDGTKIELYCNYKKASGVWSKKTMSVSKFGSDSTDQVNEAVVRMVSRLEAFYKENHFGDDDDCDASGSEAADEKES